MILLYDIIIYYLCHAFRWWTRLTQFLISHGFPMDFLICDGFPMGFSCGTRLQPLPRCSSSWVAATSGRSCCWRNWSCWLVCRAWRSTRRRRLEEGCLEEYPDEWRCRMLYSEKNTHTHIYIHTSDRYVICMYLHIWRFSHHLSQFRSIFPTVFASVVSIVLPAWQGGVHIMAGGELATALLGGARLVKCLRQWRMILVGGLEHF